MDFFDRLICDDLIFEDMLAYEDWRQEEGKNRSEIVKTKPKRNIKAEALTANEAESHLSTAMRLLNELPKTTILDILDKHGLLLRPERSPNSSFQEGYENLRKKINRTYEHSRKEALIGQLCQLYIDHNRVPKSTFKYFETYFEMQNGLLL
ncbi:hypothetical protein [Maribellus sediminis]|uniref:hypothetical protein n=1 Tax=Maribellus sediminis TaxID=2696285 RepID=UPI001431DC92|nr:hypothetical protein [Maribellus sediminis]